VERPHGGTERLDGVRGGALGEHGWEERAHELVGCEAGQVEGLTEALVGDLRGREPPQPAYAEARTRDLGTAGWRR
jgi:hypothetical protein